MADDLALHAQIAHLETSLGDRLERIEKGLIGDPDLGHEGLGRRVARIEEERRDGDNRLHQRIDAIEGRWKTAIGIAIGASVASAGGTAGLMHLLTNTPP